MVEVAINISDVDFEMIGEQRNLLPLVAKASPGNGQPIDLFLNWFSMMLYFDWHDIRWDNLRREWQIIICTIPI